LSPFLQGIPAAIKIYVSRTAITKIDLVCCTGITAKSIGCTDGIFSPDTDAIVLVIAKYELMPKVTFISMASGIMAIESIWTALGIEKSKGFASLPCVD